MISETWLSPYIPIALLKKELVNVVKLLKFKLSLMLMGFKKKTCNFVWKFLFRGGEWNHFMDQGSILPMIDNISALCKFSETINMYLQNKHWDSFQKFYKDLWTERFFTICVIQFCTASLYLRYINNKPFSLIIYQIEVTGLYWHTFDILPQESHKFHKFRLVQLYSNRTHFLILFFLKISQQISFYVGINIICNCIDQSKNWLVQNLPSYKTLKTLTCINLL